MYLIDSFQNLVAQVPEFVQPLVVALAGAVPFIEGEGAAAIGIVGGINPIVAAVAAAAGNFVCVALLVLFSSGARKAIVTRRAAVSANGAPQPVTEEAGPAPEEGESERKAARRAKFQRAFERYGVPGVSLLGPLLLPTQFTATMLAAAGIGRARVLFWQGLAIAGWTTVVTLILTGVIHTFG